MSGTAPPAPGWIRVVGLGPGDPGWLTPETARVLDEATDLVGYEPYLDRVPLRAGHNQKRHPSDNRFEVERAAFALSLAAKGARVAVISSGDPGIFAMASAVLEAMEAGDASWQALDCAVLPGLSAMQAAAARVGAPLGHDFCVISLSDYLKPWEIIEKRLRAAIEADFVLALYNPASLTRREAIIETLGIARQGRSGETPVILARAVGTAEERILVERLDRVQPETIDMRTLVIIGSSMTRLIDRIGLPPFVYTPRSYC